jgi:hypothetical protein
MLCSYADSNSPVVDLIDILIAPNVQFMDNIERASTGVRLMIVRKIGMRFYNCHQTIQGTLLAVGNGRPVTLALVWINAAEGFVGEFVAFNGPGSVIVSVSTFQFLPSVKRSFDFEQLPNFDVAESII